MAKFLKRIGYYNDIEDINKIGEKHDADLVIKYMEEYKGAFHTTNDEGTASFSDFEDGKGCLTGNGKYFVVFPETDEIEKGGDDLFIDIYEVKGSDFDYNEGHCDEWCPECDTEVELPPSIGIYRCPSCGKWMVNCSMCYLQTECKCSFPNCPLSFEAKRRNKREKDRILDAYGE